MEVFYPCCEILGKSLLRNCIPDTRKVAIRSAITFSPDAGSVFQILHGLVKAGLGGRQGSGKQQVSWIHDADFLRAVEFIIRDQKLAGVINLASPNPLPNAKFMAAFRLAVGMPIGLPAAEWMIESGAFVMRTEPELVLKSRFVLPGRLQDEGFEFRYPEWPGAVQDLVNRFPMARSPSENQ